MASLKERIDYLLEFVRTHPFTFTVILINGLATYPLLDWRRLQYEMLKDSWSQKLSVNIDGVMRGEIYRLFTYHMVHIGVVHHFYTSLLILGFVSNLEREVGWKKTAITYYISSLFIFMAVPVDYVFKEVGISQLMWEKIFTHTYFGASAAAWGCGGAYLARGWVYKERKYLFFTLINFLFGLFRKPIQGIKDYNADVAHYTAAITLLAVVYYFDWLGIRTCLFSDSDTRLLRRPDLAKTGEKTGKLVFEDFEIAD